MPVSPRAALGCSKRKLAPGATLGGLELAGMPLAGASIYSQVPFHPVWVERRLARVEVSRLPARHVGGPRVKVLNSPGQSPPRPDGRALLEKKKEGGPCDRALS